jgi:hypothetical protein
VNNCQGDGDLSEGLFVVLLSFSVVVNNAETVHDLEVRNFGDAVCLLCFPHTNE